MIEDNNNGEARASPGAAAKEMAMEALSRAGALIAEDGAVRTVGDVRVFKE